jgi:Family of unknown function (DUF6527)
MPRFRRFIDWVRDHVAPKGEGTYGRRRLPPITFSEIQAVDKPPSNGDVQEKSLYFVSFKQRPKWALFQCPCGCKSIITLSLQKAHEPHWVLKNSRARRPSLNPSVWRDVGCLSHFWIDDGRVYWCEDTGSAPRSRFRLSSIVHEQ